MARFANISIALARIAIVALCLTSHAFTFALAQPVGHPLGLVAPAPVAVPSQPDPNLRAQALAELQKNLQTILTETHTPGLSVAIVTRGNSDFTAGFGLANVAANAPADSRTLFRIGSITKAFASLSILKLVNEGKLSLSDPVRTLVPEIWFENRWEATDPVRVVDLLEHTTGWDDAHFAEYAKDARGMTTREGLDYYRRSRISRWRPGTRMAYCNTGPAVAAYIVEKISGKRYEDYVTQNFFEPIGMSSATFFEQPSPHLATLYQSDGKTANSYWNLLVRPAGAINASAEDMAAYLHFYLDRGSALGVPILPPLSIDRMEVPTRTWEAQQGLRAGYGLGNYTAVARGFVFHGHDGGVNGGVSQLDYLPESGVGYFFSINSANGDAFRRIGDLLRAYVIRGLTPPPVPAAAPLPANARDYEGWYVPDSPRNAFMAGLERLNFRRVRFRNGNLELLSLFGKLEQSFAPVTGNQFRLLSAVNPPDPIATAMLISPQPEGRFIRIEGTWQQIPAWLVILELATVVWFVLACVAILVYAPFWIANGFIRARRRPFEASIRRMPLIAVLSLIATVVIGAQAMNSPNSVALLGTLNFTSFAIYISSVVFGFATLASLIACIVSFTRRHLRHARPAVRWFSIAVTIPLLAAAAYLAYWGLLGYRTWA